VEKLKSNHRSTESPFFNCKNWWCFHVRARDRGHALATHIAAKVPSAGKAPTSNPDEQATVLRDARHATGNRDLILPVVFISRVCRGVWIRFILRGELVEISDNPHWRFKSASDKTLRILTHEIL